MTFLGRSRFRDRLRSVGGEAFPLDGVTTPTMAISTARRLTSSYTGNLLNVINAGGTPANIGYTGSNELDTAELLFRTGSGGADTGRIVRVYGQVGTLDGYQGTTTNAPWIVQAGAINTIGTRPGCKPQTLTAGVNTVTAGGTTGANLHGAQGDYTWLFVAIGPTASFDRDFYRQSAPGIDMLGWAPTTRFRHDLAVGTIIESANGTNSPGTSVRVYAGYRSGSTVEAYRNNEGSALVTGSVGGAFVPSQYTIFSGPLDRTYAEFYWWNSAIPLAELNALRANCTAYFGATYP
jgi:hypothetical protein